jgi:DNA-binding SARP family transcriptional activator
MELIVFLAMHRESAITADRLREALWPGRNPGGTTLYTTVSVARRHLGRAAGGSWHLPQLVAGDGGYHLCGSVQLDYELFAAEVASARAQEPADAMATLRTALTRVRGRPFDVTGRGYDWLHVEGISSFVELDVAGAAHRLARMCLESGDGEGARWAVRQGLRASAGNEQLFRDEMCAADLEGNPAGVEAAMADLTRVVAEEGAYGSFHPETVALYRQLSRSWQSA